MKQRLINFLLKSTLSGVIIDDVIAVDKGRIVLGGKPIGDTELRSLISEVKAFKSSRLWKILNETPKKEAFDIGWNKSITLEHLNTSKTMYRTLELQQSIIDLIEKQDKKVAT